MKIPMMDREEFMALPANERRVMIAKDVLSVILPSNRFSVENGGYLAFVNIGGAAAVKDTLQAIGSIELQTVLRHRRTQCSVCAIGALFIADVLRCNTLKVRALEQDEDDYDDDAFLNTPDDECMLPHLKDTFDAKTLRRIEAFFEGTIHHAYGAISYEELDRLKPHIHAFVRKHPDRSSRLRVICKNIIENNGEFTL